MIAIVGDGDPADSEETQAPQPRIRRRGRRVTTELSEGYIGEPPAERIQEPTENDDRLLNDKPPHWG